LLAGLDGLLTCFEVDAARHQNWALMAQQKALHEQAFDLAGRLFEGVERGRRMARLADTLGRASEGQSPRLSARDAGSEALLAWHSEQRATLERSGTN
jgi:hypothetical protein